MFSPQIVGIVVAVCEFVVVATVVCPVVVYKKHFINEAKYHEIISFRTLIASQLTNDVYKRAQSTVNSL